MVVVLLRLLSCRDVVFTWEGPAAWRSGVATTDFRCFPGKVQVPVWNRSGRDVGLADEVAEISPRRNVAMIVRDATLLIQPEKVKTGRPATSPGGEPMQTAFPTADSDVAITPSPRNSKVT